MKVITYMCENCLEPHILNQQNNNKFLCPKCGEKMIYWGTEEINPNTNKVINSYDEKERKEFNSYNPISTTPIIECPYCHSTNTKKITTNSKVLNTAIWGFFGTKRFKEWHCNECGSDF